MSKSFNFSLLGNDVDLDDRFLKKAAIKAKTEPKVSAEVPVTKPTTKIGQKALKKKQQDNSLKALAFGKPASKKKTAVTANKEGSKKSINNVANHTEALSEDWKSRDEKFVDEQNEKELREALLLSKLDYERNKEACRKEKQEQYDKMHVLQRDSTDTVEKAKPKKSKKKNKDKHLTLSLSEFNNLDDKQLAQLRNSAGQENVPASLPSATTRNSAPAKAAKISNCRPQTSSKDDNFFTDVDEVVRNTLLKESKQKQYAELEKEMSRGGLLVPVSEVEKREFEIQALRLEVDSLKEQLEKVKLRNKKLCEMLATAEIKPVSELLLELEKVKRARDEFSTEVTSLSEQLEQEKTKVSQLLEKGRKK